ncbi:MAG: DUF763 domain-containing protein [Candidatus Micrarchaeia archaeon]
MQKTGSVTLPLHPGRAPRWLFQRMVRLSKAIADAIILEYGPRELLRRLSDPVWFQALGCALAFDWHSSGLTTTTCAALKLAFSPEEHGIGVAGGKGAASRKAPAEISALGERLSLSDQKISSLTRASFLSAKVDSACVQDSHELYHHCIFFTERGEWCVVQQGMKPDTGTARRYHWLGETVGCFVEEPHAGIAAQAAEESVLDLTSGKNDAARNASVDLINDNPLHIQKHFSGQRTLAHDFSLPSHHELLSIDISPRGWAELQRAFELQPKNYEELVALRGIGRTKLRALALLSQLLFGTPLDWSDPAKYSFAHGGKDGIPFPVQRGDYDHSISVLKQAVESAKIGEGEKLRALQRLRAFL